MVIGAINMTSKFSLFVAELRRRKAYFFSVVFVLGCGGPEVPADLPQVVEWRFDQPQPDWRPAKPISEEYEGVRPVRIDDALRLPLTSATRIDGPNPAGEIYVHLPDWNLDDWSLVEIRARTRGPIQAIGLDFNYTETDPGSGGPFYSEGDATRVTSDGKVYTYRLELNWEYMDRGRWEGPWTELGIWVIGSDDVETAALDILSIRIIPKELDFRRRW